MATDYDYAYDARGRLEQVDRNTALAAAYAYDPNGNRLSRDDGVIVEQGSPEAPLTDGLADNRHWVGGIFYVNREDASILVEKRFGIGYTLNFGNFKAVTLMAVFFVLLVGLLVLGLAGTVS